MNEKPDGFLWLAKVVDILCFAWTSPVNFSQLI